MPRVGHVILIYESLVHFPICMGGVTGPRVWVRGIEMLKVQVVMPHMWKRSERQTT